MTTKKKSPPSKSAPAAKKPLKGEGAGKPKAPVRPQHSEAYEAALVQYGEAMGLLRKGDHAKALALFKAIEAERADEPVLRERARVYASICWRKLNPPPDDPQTAEDAYRLGVIRANEGRIEDAIRLLDRALQKDPDSAAYLYARASARALQGNAEAAVGDLKRAIATEPHLRFQAASDPDFEKIRDEAIFIDVIEPTPAGT